MNKISVSVVIPAFNAEATIGRALSSVLLQEMQVTEIIVIDDGSTDLTAEICRSYQSSTQVPILVTSVSNGGVSSARNRGIAMAKASYIALLDADDEWLPCHLRNFQLAIEDAPCALLYYCGIERRFNGGNTSNGEVLPDFNAMTLAHCSEEPGRQALRVSKSIVKDLIYGNFIPTSAAVVRSNYAKKNLFLERFSVGEDRLFFLRVVSDGLTIFTPTTGCLIHRHDHNASLTTDAEKNLRNNRNSILVFREILLMSSIECDVSNKSALEAGIRAAEKRGVYYAAELGVPQTCMAIVSYWRALDRFSAGDYFYVLKNMAKSFVSSINSRRSC